MSAEGPIYLWPTDSNTLPD